jgi:hypothetical protein
MSEKTEKCLHSHIVDQRNLPEREIEVKGLSARFGFRLIRCADCRRFGLRFLGFADQNRKLDTVFGDHHFHGPELRILVGLLLMFMLSNDEEWAVAKGMVETFLERVIVQGEVLRPNWERCDPPETREDGF